MFFSEKLLYLLENCVEFSVIVEITHFYYHYFIESVQDHGKIQRENGDFVQEFDLGLQENRVCLQ